MQVTKPWARTQHNVTLPTGLEQFIRLYLKDKGYACMKNQEDAAFENLLSFTVLKENGQKDKRCLQIIHSSVLNSEQVTSSVT